MENTSFAYLEAKEKVWAAYLDYCSNEQIIEEGFNPNNKDFYISFESGIKISCALGEQVKYFGYDENTNEKISFSSYIELIYHLGINYQLEN